MNKYDYVKYDERHANLQKVAQSLVRDVDEFIEGLGNSHVAVEIHNPDFALQSRFYDYIGQAHNKLEEAYMYIGKAVRDHQILSGGDSKDVLKRG